MNKSNTFSLVELLVVVAIIGILTSMLLPSLKNAYEKSKQGVCGSQLRQLMMGTSMSIDDQQGYFHSPNGTSTGTYYNPLWSRWLVDNKYIKSESVFLCPSRSEGSYNPGWSAYGARYSSDGTPYFTGSNGGDVAVRDFDTETWMFGDSFSSSDRFHRMTLSLNSNYAQPWMIHGMKGNMAFFDGHVESLGAAQYKKLGFNDAWTQGKVSISL